MLRHNAEEIEDYLQGEWREHLEDAARGSGGAESRPCRPSIRSCTRCATRPEAEDTACLSPRRSGQSRARSRPAALCFDLCAAGTPPPFSRGSGRLDLAEAIADPRNPLTARVMVNRIWQHHFGQGLVRTPEQFRRTGRAPHASRAAGLPGAPLRGEEVVDEGHASRDHALGGVPVERRLFRRQLRGRSGQPAAVARQPAAAGCRIAARRAAVRLRQSGSEAGRSPGEARQARPIAGARSTVSSAGASSTRCWRLFDFANPNSTSDQRMATNVPLQRLFFMNSDLVAQQSRSLAGLLKAGAGRRGAHPQSVPPAAGAGGAPAGNSKWDSSS